MKTFDLGSNEMDVDYKIKTEMCNAAPLFTVELGYNVIKGTEYFLSL